MRISMEKVARGLGVASIGLGLAEIVAPGQLQRFLGVGKARKTGVLGVLGVREVMHGIDVLAHQKPAVGMWGRVAGDMLDLVLLNMLAKQTRRPGNVAIAFGLVLGITALDVICARRLSKPAARPEEEFPIRRRVGRRTVREVPEPVEVS